MGIYDSIGAKTYINACATVTLLGGSIMPPEVLDAMREASRHYVSIVDLQKKAGAHIAEITHNEGAFISNGAAAGIMLTIAATIAGDDKEKRMKLPHTEGMANEVLVYAKGRVGYDFAIQQAGGKVVEYGDENGATEEQLEAAITDKTCAIFVFQFEHRMDKQIPVKKQVEIGHRHGIPVYVDAAAQLPMRENLWRYTRDWGVDAAIFSGGKGLRGPQSSGLVVGKKELTDRLITYGCPNTGIGRPLKVGKEEIIGLMRAVELFMEADEAAVLADYEQQVQDVIDAFAGTGIAVTRDFPSEAGQPMPRAKVCVPGKAKAVADAMYAGDPGIMVTASADDIYLNPQTLLPGEMAIVIAELKKQIAAC